jgi:hypothetical protein
VGAGFSPRGRSAFENPLVFDEWDCGTSRAKWRETPSVKTNPAIVHILVSVLQGAVGQVLPKKGMSNMGPVTLSLNQLPAVLFQRATNPYVVIRLLIYVGGSAFWLSALSRVDLSYAYPFASLS